MNTDRLSYTGRIDAGAWCRAIDIARELFRAGLWDGQAGLTIHAPYILHGRIMGIDRLPVTELTPGKDYEVTP